MFDIVTKILELSLLLAGIIIGFIQLRAVWKQMQQQNAWNKKDATFKYLEKYDENLKKTANSISVLLKKNSIEKIMSDKRAEIIDLVAYFDNLAIGIETNYFDDPIAERSLFLQAKMVFSELENFGYFRKRKEEEGCEVAINFQNLVLRWRLNYNSEKVIITPNKKAYEMLSGRISTIRMTSDCWGDCACGGSQCICICPSGSCSSSSNSHEGQETEEDSVW